MAQLSRPFQIALVAVGVLVAVWFLALHGHSSSSSSGSTPPSSQPATPGSQAEKAAAPSHVYTGPAPGVSGLSRAVAKAHEAVATSQQNAAQLQQKSAQASGATAPSASPGKTPAPTASATPKAAATPAVAPTAGARASTKAAPAGSTAHKQAVAPRRNVASGISAAQRKVEAELKQGKIVVLLFWNRKGADDVVTHKGLQLLVKLHHEAAKAKAEEVRHADKFFGFELDKAIAVHEAPASAVASYGTITRGVQVYGTPTILIVNPRHRASTLTGATDAYSIEQAIEEARHG